jgi:hypothetical protein
VRPAALGICPADDDELLAVQALRLDPDPAVTKGIWLIHPLRDDVLQAKSAGVLAEAGAIGDNVLALVQPVNFLLEKGLEPIPALNQW